MVVLGAILALLFIQPSYYRLKSKGYPASPYIPVTVVACGLSWLGAQFYPQLIILAFVSSICLFFIARSLPTKPGAPGDAFFKITFECSYCHQSVTFPREREGNAVLCPKCGELIRVPT